MNQKFRFLEHTADVKFQAFGSTLEKAFENSGLALKQIVYEEKVQGEKEKKIEIKGKDFESLLYNFLEEILYLIEAENFLISRVKNLEISKDISDKKNFKLNATILGDKTSDYQFTNKVKAITYNEMFVKKEKGKWIAQVVLDV